MIERKDNKKKKSWFKSMMNFDWSWEWLMACKVTSLSNMLQMIV